jgi:acetylornithine deacetylase
MLPDVVETLCDLVRIPSVNPMGRPLVGPEYLEQALTQYLQTFFQNLGVAWLRQTVEPRRDNILAGIPGSVPPGEGGRIVVFEAHQDTVPVDGMTIPPWTPEIRDGRVYGRGSCDIKGGMACMLTAFARLARQRPSSMPTVIMACSVNEEHGFTGATSLARLWTEGEFSLVPRVPDSVIVAEPTGLNVVVAHKGVVRWRCHTRGIASHSSTPQAGRNAIYEMARVLAALEGYSRDTVPSLGHHPLLGSPTLSVGVVAGGVSVNTVPDHCVIEIDRRLLPNERKADALRHAANYLAERCPAITVTHDEPFLSSPGFSDDGNRQLAAQLSGAARACEAPGNIIGVPYGTDAPAFAEVGAPTVVFGPGSIEQAHTADEWIAVDQLRQATEIYYRFGSQADPQ